MIRLFENDFFNYLGLVVVGSGFLWCVLRLALRGVRHDIARGVLLASLTLTAVAPLVSVAVYPAPQVIATQVTYDATLAYIAAEVPAQMPAAGSWITPTLYIIYSIVALVLLGRMVRNVVKIKRLGRPDANSMVVSEAVERPFTFLNTIYIGVADAAEAMIVSHERAHARLHHSWDRLFVEAVAALFWINPFVYLLRRDLREVHEFQADEAVTREGCDRENYKTLIFSRMLGTSPEIAGGLAYILTKKRIAMISQTHTRGWKRSLLLLPAVAALIATVTFTTKTASAQEPTAQTTSDNTIKIYVDGNLYTGKLNDLDPKAIHNITVTANRVQVSLQNDTDGTITMRKRGNTQATPVKFYVNGRELTGNQSTIISGTINSISADAKSRQIYISSVMSPEEAKLLDTLKMRSGYTFSFDTNDTKAGSAGNSDITPVTQAETMPTFQGQDGKSAFPKWLRPRLKYPVGKKIKGTLQISFVIDQSGKLTDAKVVRGVDKELDQQVLDLINSAPAEWTPAMNNGKPVNCLMMLIPIEFMNK